MSIWKCFACLRFKDDENVTTLDYSNSTLTDVPPDVSQYERTLEQLLLSANRISDLPPELFYCLGLKVLKLNDNELESLPNAIGSLRQLQTLDLSRNAISQIPDQIKACKNLTHLDLSLNNLQRLPDAITSLISLQELLLNETYLEFLPANFGRLVKLKILELRSNNLITLPKSMARLVELQRIDIGANEFTELPEVVGQLTQLRELWIDCNRIRRISNNIANLRELVHFEANNNQLTTLPNEIGNWLKLEVISLSANDLEELPFSIGMLKRLMTLKVDSNQLRELPDSICKLDGLEEMIISHNFITRLPTTVGLMRRLRFLAADENLLRRVPNEICSCIALSVLSLRGNKIAELPPDIGHLVNLRVVNIVDNCIRYLPVSTLNLRQLSALWIGNNQSQPLVPLQYADNIAKTQLTCIMLPQIEAVDNTAAAATMGSAITTAEQGEWLNLQQKQRNMYPMPSANIGSPSRRICFADETGIKTTDTITSRLMRSPTPYPKELRLMAKYLRNTHQYRENEMVSPTQSAQSKITRTNQVELSVPDDVEVGGGVRSDDVDHQQQSGLCIKEARVLSNVHPCDNGNSDTVYLYDMLTPQPHDSTTSNYMNVHSNTNIYGYSQQFYGNNVYPQPLQHPTMTQQFYQPHSNYIDPYNNSIYEHHESLYGTSAHSPSIQSFQQHSQPSPQQQYIAGDEQYVQKSRQPPPYHIAKAFTKKSREDLLYYDTIRNHGGGQTPIEDNHPQDNNNVDTYASNNLNNNLLEMKEAPENGHVMTNGSSLLYDDDEDGGCHDHHEQNGEEERLEPSARTLPSPVAEDADAASVMSSTALKGTSQWLFGLHKNPTVKQVIVKKDPILGFEIKEKQNEKGIFISITMPNTSASSLLRADDKLLDVDGTDFTQASFDEAQRVLMDSGPIVTIMVSRK